MHMFFLVFSTLTGLVVLGKAAQNRYLQYQYPKHGEAKVTKGGYMSLKRELEEESMVIESATYGNHDLKDMISEGMEGVTRWDFLVDDSVLFPGQEIISPANTELHIVWRLEYGKVK